MLMWTFRIKALAVHPDYELRENVLRQLRDRWMPLTPDGWHSVVAGLTREHQFELALDHIANMEKNHVANCIPPTIPPSSVSMSFQSLGL